MSTITSRQSEIKLLVGQNFFFLGWPWRQRIWNVKNIIAVHGEKLNAPVLLLPGLLLEVMKSHESTLETDPPWYNYNDLQEIAQWYNSKTKPIVNDNTSRRTLLVQRGDAGDLQYFIGSFTLTGISFNQCGKSKFASQIVKKKHSLFLFKDV